MLRHALACIFGLFLTGCTTLQPQQQDALSVVTCAAEAPMVSDALRRGEPALRELADALSGSIAAIRAGENPSTEQLAALVELERTLAEVRSCLSQ